MKRRHSAGATGCAFDSDGRGVGTTSDATIARNMLVVRRTLRTPVVAQFGELFAQTGAK
jgi:hypothetical protein